MDYEWNVRYEIIPWTPNEGNEKHNWREHIEVVQDVERGRRYNGKNKTHHYNKVHYKTNLRVFCWSPLPPRRCKNESCKKKRKKLRKLEQKWKNEACCAR